MPGVGGPPLEAGGGALGEAETLGDGEFVDAYAKRLPIVTFLRLVDLPLGDRDELLELTELSVRPESQADQIRAFTGLQQYIGRWIVERRHSRAEQRR